MRKSNIFVLEEELNIVALHDLELEANKTGEYDLLYNKVKSDADAKEAKESEDESNTEDEESGIDSDDTNPDEDKPEDSSEENTDDVVQQTPAEEEYRSLLKLNYSLENEVVVDAAKTIGSLAIDGLKFLGHIGITHGPDIAKHVLKGVLYAMDRIIKLLFVSIKGLKNFINRSFNSFTGFQEDISKLKAAVNALEDKKDNTITNSFTNVNIINNIKIGDSSDVLNNIKVLNTYLNKVVNNLDKVIQDELLSIKQMMSVSTNSMSKVSLDLMKFTPKPSILKKMDVKGYDSNSDNVVGYASGVTLPGDVMLIAHLPNEVLDGSVDLAEAYNASSMFLGINSVNYKSIEKINYLDKKQLISLLDELDNTCKLCLSHKKVYENILKTKFNLRYNFKNYFNSILMSGDKITLKNSMMEMIQLKTHFVDKVYITTAMDIHDYAIKVMNSSLTYVKKNITVL